MEIHDSPLALGIPMQRKDDDWMHQLPWLQHSDVAMAST